MFPLSLLLVVTACTSSRDRDIQTDTSDAPEDNTPAPKDDDPRKRLAGANWLKNETKRSITVAREEVRIAHKIRPDKRFLQAMSDATSLISGTPSGETEITARPKGWSIKIQNDEIGVLSEFADFEEQYSLLRKWIKKQYSSNLSLVIPKAQTPAKSNAHEKEASITALWNSLRNAEKQRAEKTWNVDTFKTGSATLALLYWECLDLLQSGTDLAARALATMAICEELTGADLLRYRCLLAEAMGYNLYAQEHAKSLPDTDAAKHFLLGDTKRLAALAASPAASAQTKYFYLRLLGINRDLASWQAEAKRGFFSDLGMTLPVMRSYYDVAQQNTVLGYSTSLLAAINRTLLNATDEKHPITEDSFEWSYEAYSESQEWVLKDVAKEFEGNLAQSKFQAQGFFVSNLLYQQFYRAHFNSAVSLISDSYFSMPEGAKNCIRLANSLKMQLDSPSAALERWLRMRIEERQGKSTFASLDSELLSIAKLGPEAVLTLCSGLDLQFSESDPGEALRFGNKVLSIVDSRPECRVKLASVVDGLLLDLRQSVRTIQSTTKSGQPRNFYSSVQQAILTREQARLEKLIAQAQIRPRERLLVLHCLEESPNTNAKLLVQQYGKLAQSAPNDWWAIEPLYTLLWNGKRYADASKLVSSWIQKQKTFKFLDEAKARTALAQVLLAQGKTQDALKALDKTQMSEQFICLAMRALVLEDMGKREDAETWVAECIKRYPNEANSISLGAEILWRNGKYSKAAGFLAANNTKISRIDWRYIVGKSFVNAFEKTPLKVEMAVNAMIDTGINSPENLGQIAAALYGADRAAEAFSIVAKLQVNSVERADVLVCAYRYLKRWKGEKEALNWLLKEIPKGFDPIALAPYAFLSGQNELLWTAIPDDKMSDDVAVLRAATLCADEHPDVKRKESLLKRFAGRSDLRAQIVRYLLTSKKDDSIFSAVLENKEISKAAFYVGWKSLLKPGQFLDDIDWYRVSIENGSGENAEFRWSWIWLSDIQLSLRRFNKLINAQAVDNLHVTMPKTGKWDEQRRFGLRER